jgi:hypothetical protein
LSQLNFCICNHCCNHSTCLQSIIAIKQAHLRASLHSNQLFAIIVVTKLAHLHDSHHSGTSSLRLQWACYGWHWPFGLFAWLSSQSNF